MSHYCTHSIIIAETAINQLLMLSAISRKDFFAQTRDNEAYVTEELDTLMKNDTW
jgi:hypothetical protein